MKAIKLVAPTAVYESQVAAYKKEFLINGDSMDGTANLRNLDSFEDWLSAIKDNSSEETVRAGLVPASTYLAVREEDDYIVGMIDIRHRLNDYLFKFGGHIGYSVRKSERLQGYAKEMLRLGLEACRALKIEKVLITCDKENTGSAKTIIANGGVLENEVQEEDRVTQRYWITL